MNYPWLDAFGTLKVVIRWEHDIGEPKRKHKKKRITKKWLKKYGTWYIPCSKGVIYYFDNTMVVSRNTYAMIKDHTRWKLEFEPCGHHGNANSFIKKGERI